MKIREMSRDECLRVLARERLARLGCAHEGQPYVVPVSLAYEEASGCLYGFTTPGQKVEWMRANPRVCVEVDHVSAHDQWVSVIATGRFEELPETSGGEGARPRAPERPRNIDDPVSPWSDDSSQCLCEGEAGGDERERAWRFLSTDPVWGEAGFAAWAARARRDPPEPFTPIYYRIRIDRVTGHEATRDPRDAANFAQPAAPAGIRGWLRKTLTRVFGGGSKGTVSAS